MFLRLFTFHFPTVTSIVLCGQLPLGLPDIIIVCFIGDFASYDDADSPNNVVLSPHSSSSRVLLGLTNTRTTVSKSYVLRFGPS